MDELNTQAAEPSQPSPANKLAEMENRLKGLQSALNEKHASAVQLEQQLKSTLTAKEAEVQTYRGQLTTVEQRAKELQEANTQMATQLADAQKAAAKADVIRAVAKKGLLEDYDNGLLRTDLSGNDFEKFLDQYAARLSGTAQQAKEQVMNGAIPPSGGGSTRQESMNRAQLNAAIQDALMKGERAKYDELYTQMINLKE